VPLIAGKASFHHMVIDIGRESVLIQEVLGIELELGKGR
jgi:hypothetical protein